MREIVRQRIDWEPVDRHHQAPVLDGINESFVLIDKESNKPILIHYLLEDDLIQERRWLARQLKLGTKWPTTTSKTGTMRLNGMNYESHTFGTTAPVPLRRRYGCQYAAFNTQYPDAYSVLQKLTSHFWDKFHELMPDEAEKHENLVHSAIHKDWLISGVGWTSGIINNTAALPYHKDISNIGGSLSAMLGMRSRLKGGGLHLPEYDITLGIPDGSLTIFDGQKYWHGVTPLVNERVDGYRYTIVWYAKNGIKICTCAEDEPRRAALRSTEITDMNIKSDE